MVTQYGMSDIGLISYPQSDNEMGIGNKPYSPHTEALIEAEVNKIINYCAERTRNIVSEHKQQIEGLAKEVLEKETVDLIDILRILGDRPFPLTDSMKDYLREIEIRKKKVEESLKKEKEDAEKKDKEDTDKKDKDDQDKKSDDYDKDKGSRGDDKDKKKGGEGKPAPRNETEKKIEEAETIIKFQMQKDWKL